MLAAGVATSAHATDWQTASIANANNATIRKVLNLLIAPPNAMYPVVIAGALPDVRVLLPSRD